jgi:hypothetical protein
MVRLLSALQSKKSYSKSETGCTALYWQNQLPYFWRSPCSYWNVLKNYIFYTWISSSSGRRGYYEQLFAKSGHGYPNVVSRRMINCVISFSSRLPSYTSLIPTLTLSLWEGFRITLLPLDTVFRRWVKGVSERFTLVWNRQEIRIALVSARRKGDAEETARCVRYSMRMRQCPIWWNRQATSCLRKLWKTWERICEENITYKYNAQLCIIEVRREISMTLKKTAIVGFSKFLD